MSIFLIRHGETALNAARVVQPADTPLSERGIAQAEALALRLASAGIGRILSSDLLRALRTAQAIAAHSGAKISVSPLLRERNFGDLRGRPYDSLPGNPMASADAPPGGESGADFEARAAEAWRLIDAAEAAITGADAGGHLAVVTHGLMIRALLAAAQPPERLPDHLGNTSVSILDRSAALAGGSTPPERAHWVAKLTNCTAHLHAGRRDDPNALSGA